MTKLKRLAISEDNLVQVDTIPSEEILDRQLYYPILSPKNFARKFNKLFIPTTLQFETVVSSIQLNHCVNPYCCWFGKPQKRYENIKNKPSRYKLTGRGKERKSSITCNPDPEDKKKSLSCTVTPISNLAVADEIKLLATNDSVVDIEPNYVIHKEGCDNETTPCHVD